MVFFQLFGAKKACQRCQPRSISVSGRQRSPPGPLLRWFRRNGPNVRGRNVRSSKAMAGTRRCSVGWEETRGKGRYGDWKKNEMVGVFECYGTYFLFLVWWGKDRLIKHLLTKVLTQFFFIFFSGFLYVSILCDQKTVCTYTKKNAYTTYIEEFYNARSQRFLHGPCLKMVWCLSVLWEDETDETDQPPPNNFCQDDRWVNMFI